MRESYPNLGNGKSEDYISMKEFVNDKFDNFEKSVDAKFESVTQATNAALAAADKAIVKSEIALEKRMDSVNEFRGQLKDQQDTFLTLDVYNAKHELLRTQVDEVKRYIANDQGKTEGLSKGWLILIGALGLVATIINIVYVLFL